MSAVIDRPGAHVLVDVLAAEVAVLDAALDLEDQARVDVDAAQRRLAAASAARDAAARTVAATRARLNAALGAHLASAA